MINILIIDDDKNTRFLLYEVLKMNNFNVFQATNGLEGLEVLEKDNRKPRDIEKPIIISSKSSSYETLKLAKCILVPSSEETVPSLLGVWRLYLKVPEDELYSL